MTLCQSNPIEFQRTYAIEALEKELARLNHFERLGLHAPKARQAIENAIYLLKHTSWPHPTVLSFPTGKKLSLN